MKNDVHELLHDDELEPEGREEEVTEADPEERAEDEEEELAT